MVFPLVSMMMVLMVSYTNRQTVLNNRILTSMLFWMMMAAVTLNIVFRDLHFIDTDDYLTIFYSMQSLSFTEVHRYLGGDYLYQSVSWLISRFTMEPRVYLGIMGLLFLVPFVKFITRLFEPWQTVVVLFAYINFPLFYNYSMNGIRQGIAMSLILWASTYYFLDKKGKVPYVLILLAPFFHWSGGVFAVMCLLLLKLNIKLRTLMIAWLAAAALLITGLNERLLGFAWAYIPKIDQYTSAYQIAAYGGKLNRTDFLLFSLVWIAVGLFMYYFVNRSETYQRIIKAYVIFNTAFLLLGFVAHSDRIAAYSWFLIPLLIFYPIVQAKKYSWLIAFAGVVGAFAVGWYTDVYQYYNLFHIF